MNILLLSAYDAVSHQYWHKNLVENLSEHQWTVLCLEPRYFSWRIRGNSLSWAFNERETLEKEYDLLIATSMVDLNGLRGFVPSLGQIPNILYFHENQFAYPPSPAKNQNRDKKAQNKHLEAKIVSLYSALCADQIIFNSNHNRDTFFLGVKNLLHSLPDHIPKNIPETLQEKSSVLPVPIVASAFHMKKKHEHNKLQVVWNHRWEYDKGPERLHACIQALPKDCLCEFHIVGQGFRNTPEIFELIKAELKKTKALGHWGYIEDTTQYKELLLHADVVLSTALHDFQGLSVLEAVAAGCVPVVPDRLAYPEFFSSQYRYLSALDNIAEEAKSAASMLVKLSKEFLQKPRKLETKLSALTPNVTQLSWETLSSTYSDTINKTVESYAQRSKKR